MLRRTTALAVALVALSQCGAPEGARSVRTPGPGLAVLPRYDWIGIVGTGQSLGVGAGGRPPLSVVQPYGNLMLADLGPRPGYALDPRSALVLVPLVEPLRPFWASGDGQYPTNIHGETPSTSMANELSVLSGGRPGTRTSGLRVVSLHSVVGWGGHCMSDIDKSGPSIAYAASLAEARAFKRMAVAENKSFAYAGVTLTHGECDSMSPTYEADLHRLWEDYDADLRAVTGQAEPIVLLVSQQHTYPHDSHDTQRPLSALAALAAGRDFPGQIVCTGPKYQYAYTPDGVHMDAASYRRLGEKYAEVLDQVFFRRRPWKPLQPRASKRDGLVITLAFDVPNPPLAWDETLLPPHQTELTEWARGRGFEVETPQGRVPIADVRIAGDSVTLTLAAPPRGAPVTVRYAMTQDADARPSPRGGPIGRRGQLCDSDALRGWDAETVACRVEHGSPVVRAAPTANGAPFAARTRRDVVVAPGLPAGTVVLEKTSEDELTLSSPWAGPSGTSSLSFYYDQRNFAVAFALDVP
jgi:hypothetical protein